MGDPAALARTIKRAATEPGLWPRLAGALPTPPSRAKMAEGFRRIYRGEGRATNTESGNLGRRSHTAQSANGAGDEDQPSARRRTRIRQHPAATSLGP